VSCATAAAGARAQCRQPFDCFYFALGEGDVYAIVDLPDGTTDAIAFALAVAASGTATTSTIALSTAEEVDLAARKTLDYRAPVS
jgi:uncharacterized protein with GYD domain